MSAGAVRVGGLQPPKQPAVKPGTVSPPSTRKFAQELDPTNLKASKAFGSPRTDTASSMSSSRSGSSSQSALSSAEQGRLGISIVKNPPSGGSASGTARSNGSTGSKVTIGSRHGGGILDGTTAQGTRHTEQRMGVRTLNSVLKQKVNDFEADVEEAKENPGSKDLKELETRKETLLVELFNDVKKQAKTNQPSTYAQDGKNANKEKLVLRPTGNLGEIPVLISDGKGGETVSETLDSLTSSFKLKDLSLLKKLVGIEVPPQTSESGPEHKDPKELTGEGVANKPQPNPKETQQIEKVTQKLTSLVRQRKLVGTYSTQSHHLRTMESVCKKIATELVMNTKENTNETDVGLDSTLNFSTDLKTNIEGTLKGDLVSSQESKSSFSSFTRPPAHLKDRGDLTSKLKQANSGVSGNSIKVKDLFDIYMPRIDIHKKDEDKPALRQEAHLKKGEGENRLQENARANRQPEMQIGRLKSTGLDKGSGINQKKSSGQRDRSVKEDILQEKKQKLTALQNQLSEIVAKDPESISDSEFERMSKEADRLNDQLQKIANEVDTLEAELKTPSATTNPAVSMSQTRERAVL